MKFKDILLSATTNMLRSKVRTFLTIIAVFIGAFTISLTVGVNIGVNDYIDKQLGVFGTGSTLEVQANKPGENFNSNGPQKYNPDEAGTSSNIVSTIKYLTPKDIAAIESIDGIEKVEPYRMVSVDYIIGKNGEKYKANIYGAYEGMIVDVAEGQAININNAEAQIDLPIDYVKPMGYSSNLDTIGKTAKIAVTNQVTGKQTEVNVKIVGVANNNIIQSMFMISNKAAINEMFDLTTANLPESLKNQYFTSTATVSDNISDEKLDKIKQELRDKGYSALTVDDQIGMVRDVINAITAILTAFGVIALFAASFGIINTLFMAVQERTREIGLMKAMGLGKGRVFTLFSIEAVMIGFWGSFLGVLVASGVGAIINNIAATSFLKNLNGFVLIKITLPAALTIMFIVMLIAFLAGTLPARRAAKQDPIEALRYE